CLFFLFFISSRRRHTRSKRDWSSDVCSFDLAYVMVTEQEVYHLEEGQQVKITTDNYPGVVFKGKITFISEKGDEVHNYQVEVTRSEERRVGKEERRKVMVEGLRDMIV